MDSNAKERAARGYLMGVASECGSALNEYVAEVGPVEAAARVRRIDAPDEVVAEAWDWPLNALAKFDYATAAERLGARLVIPEDSEWPERLLSPLGRSDLEAASSGIPLGLWVRGTDSLKYVLEHAVAVVGLGVATTAYGSLVAEALGRGLAKAGVTVVSGVGYGTSMIAHRATMDSGGVALAVLGCGMRSSYLGDDVVTEVAQGGVLLSRFAPGRPYTRARQLASDSFVACLGAGTVVVEADHESRGAASAAAAFGRVAMAVPGPVTTPGSRECNEMLRSGEAIVVNSAADVVESCSFTMRPEVTE